MPVRTHAPECAKTLSVRHDEPRLMGIVPACGRVECTCPAEHEDGALSAAAAAVLRAENARLRSAVVSALDQLNDWGAVTSESLKAERLLEAALCQEEPE